MRPPLSAPVHHPVMHQHWRTLTFLHWRYDPAVVQRHLPPGLRVQTFDGTAWIGLVPFVMDRVRAPGVPSLPWLSRFPETNVRTYVVGPDGFEGIWFFSLDAARLPAVLAGRTTYGLPYRWAEMTVETAGDTVTYRSRRRSPDRAGCAATVACGAPFPEAELTAVDHFLTARFRLYATVAGRLVAADADHGPWPLRRARLHHLRENLVTAAGLPAPAGEPLLHFSDGVAVRIGRWRRVAKGPLVPLR